MGWKRFKEDYNNAIAQMEAKDEAKRQAKEEMRKQQEELNPPKAPMTETEKLAKKGNILVTGFAIWYLIPFFAVVLIIGLVAVVGVYDWIFG